MTTSTPAAEHLDFLIVGAGLSGIGAAHHFQEAFPNRTYAILESRAALGGTWDLFRYPGVRSDSDMLTLGFRFKPWGEPETIADGAKILAYLQDTAREFGIDRQIRYQHKVVAANWSSREGLWEVTAERSDTGESVSLTTPFLMVCSGYYRYDEGYTPDFEGIENFGGTVVHPQQWPDDLDVTDKRVVIIGSGATAVTLVPHLAKQAALVTMLQRTPSYVVSLSSRDPLRDRLSKVLPVSGVYRALRARNITTQLAFYQLSRRRPDYVRRLLRKATARQLPEGYDVDTHFNPPYNPWTQRVCFVPSGDLYRSIREGRASVVTDQVARFNRTGLELQSGEALNADVVVTATGLNLLAFGGMVLSVDGETITLADTMSYEGMMLSGVPNLAYVIGYTNMSWTLKADLVAEYVVRVLKHFDRSGTGVFTPRRDSSVLGEPLLDFTSGYVQRSVDDFPKQGTRAPWRLHQNYFRDLLHLRFGPLGKEVDESSVDPSRPITRASR